MKKSFKVNTPLTNLTVAAQESGSNKKSEPEKRKVGRPKTKDVKGTCRNVNIAIPICLLDKWDEVKIVHSANFTEYVTKLIAKDMEANYDNYKSMADSLKKL